MDDSSIEKQILEIVPTTGKPIGNKALLTELKKAFNDLDDDTFWRVRNNLLENGKLGKGKGKGGSVYSILKSQVVPKPQAEKDNKKRISEGELYDPVHKIIKDTWAKNEGLDDCLSEITANQGKKKTGGKWTRPDISLISIKSYQYLIGKFMDVITFEIKPVDNFGIESVFETASQSVFAHKSYLCIHLPNGNPETEEFDKIQRQCENFGIGLITFEKPDSWDTYETIIEPRRKDPDPHEVNLFITQQLSSKLKEELSKKIK